MVVYRRASQADNSPTVRTTYLIVSICSLRNSGAFGAPVPLLPHGSGKRPQTGPFWAARIHAILRHDARKKMKRERRVRPGPVSARKRSPGTVHYQHRHQEFLDKGYEGASLTDISGKCHISKTTLYHLFRNKEELFSHIATASISLHRYNWTTRWALNAVQGDHSPRRRADCRRNRNGNFAIRY